jgi:hypothetical protein
MPVTVCTSCSAKLKVKDELAGKSIKCPKCAKVFKVADAEPVSAAVTAGVAETAPAKKPPPPPPPAWDTDDEDEVKPKKKPRTRADDDEEDAPKPKPKAKQFDDGDDADTDDEAPFKELLEQTQLDDSTKKQIQADLGLREKGIWVGQPDPKIMAVRALGKSAIGIFIGTIFCIVFGIMAGGAIGLHWAIATGGAVFVWLMLAVALCVSIPFMDRRKALATAYVITNKRCITYTASWFGTVTPESFYPDLLRHMRRMQSWFFGKDAGDLVFRSVTTITTTHHSRGGTSTSVQTTYFGFLGIRGLDEIERKIRQALLTDDDDDDDDEDDRRSRKKKKRRRRDDDDDD